MYFVSNFCATERAKWKDCAKVQQLLLRILTLLLTLFARLSILRLLTSLLQTTRVAQRHKVQRMHLQDAKYLGLMHLRIKRFEQVLHYFHIQMNNLTLAVKVVLCQRGCYNVFCKFPIVEFQAGKLTKKTSLVPYSLVCSWSTHLWLQEGKGAMSSISWHET